MEKLSLMVFICSIFLMTFNMTRSLPVKFSFCSRIWLMVGDFFTSIFVAISAFSNAGFDNFGKVQASFTNLVLLL